MTAEEYHAAPGLSNSGLKDLAISPFRYWHRHINPLREPEEPTPFMNLGTALHYAVLQPDILQDHCVPEVDVSQYENVLVTMDDLRGWLADKGIKPAGRKKSDLVQQIRIFDSEVAIMDALLEEHAQQHAGKLVFKTDDWKRIIGMAESLRSEPKVQEILENGEPEVPIFVTDPETGTPLKGRLDWVTPKCTLDLKTFSQQRGKSIDKSISSAIWYERYHIQGYFYSLLRSLREQKRIGEVAEHVIAFVESDEPYEVRLRVLRPRIAGEVQLFWERARLEVSGLVRQYADYMAEFGTEKPWRYAQKIEELVDQDLPSMSYL